MKTVYLAPELIELIELRDPETNSWLPLRVKQIAEKQGVEFPSDPCWFNFVLNTKSYTLGIMPDGSRIDRIEFSYMPNFEIEPDDIVIPRAVWKKFHQLFWRVYPSGPWDDECFIRGMKIGLEQVRQNIPNNLLDKDLFKDDEA